MKSPKQKREIAQSEARHKTLKIVSGLVPVGATLYELFTAIVTPLHEQRREEWMREVAMRLDKLEKEGVVNLEDLSQNEEFNTIITRATLLALQTHQKEKKNAFKNIVTETALHITADDLDFDEMHVMLTILERLSSLHIYLLTMMDNLRERAQKAGIEVNDKPIDLKAGIVFRLDDTLKDKKDMVNLCWVDLISNGLVLQNSQRGGNDIEYASNPRLSPIGKKLLLLIKNGD